MIDGSPPVIDRFDHLLATLPPDIQQEVLEVEPEQLLEVRAMVGYPLTINLAGKLGPVDHLIIEKRHVDYVLQKLDGKMRSDWRAGLDQTLHRFSGVPNRENGCVGIAVRVARAHTGAAEVLRDYILDPETSMMLVGKPGSRKTTVLRDISRISSVPQPEGVGLNQLCVIVDTSGEIAGFGDIPHPAIGPALRIEVGDPKYQASKLRIAIRNLTASRLIIDEVGYNDDVEQVQSCSNLGVGVFCTLHGYDLKDVKSNKKYWPLLGIESHTSRPGKCSFKQALVLHGPNKWTLHEDAGAAFDKVLAGETPKGIRIGSAWKDESTFRPLELSA